MRHPDLKALRDRSRGDTLHFQGRVGRFAAVGLRTGDVTMSRPDLEALRGRSRGVIYCALPGSERAPAAGSVL
eukprot:6394430-Prymnesium_polylepis.1